MWFNVMQSMVNLFIEHADHTENKFSGASFKFQTPLHYVYTN